jgi:hypothetical protein
MCNPQFWQFLFHGLRFRLKAFPHLGHFDFWETQAVTMKIKIYAMAKYEK